jgi:hypothetical protein
MARQATTLHRNDADRYRDDIEAFDRMLRLLEADEDLDMITLFELQEGTLEHAFWIDMFTDFKRGRRTYRDATWRFAMSEEDLRHNLSQAQMAYQAAVAGGAGRSAD